MTGALLAVAAAFGASVAAERRAARPEAPPDAWAALPARAALFGMLYLAWLGAWNRPYLAALASAVTVGAHVFISNRKRELVREPLVFSDYGLLRLVWRHPDLYYTEFMARPPFLLGAAAFVVALGSWFWLEPSLLPAGFSLVLLLGVLALASGATVLARHPTVVAWGARLLPYPDLERDVGRWGLLLTLAAYALRWRAETACPPREGRPGLPPDLADEASVHPIQVIVVQLESFVDPPRLWAAEQALPGLARTRALAWLHGPLAVPAHGAFTMRSEYAVLTGLAPEDLGFRRFDPYLSTRGATPPTLASRLKARGFSTIFLHPFRAAFFDRARVVPRFGFDRLLFEENFPDEERYGPYVSDAALARRILAETAGGAPALAFAVTMENHGPWLAGRLADEPDPVRQYRRHLAHSDEAITILIEGLSRREGRTLLCLYGDHTPILPGLTGSEPSETDYAVLLLGRDAPAAAPRERRLAAHELGRVLARLSGADDPSA